MYFTAFFTRHPHAAIIKESEHADLAIHDLALEVGDEAQFILVVIGCLSPESFPSESTQRAATANYGVLHQLTAVQHGIVNHVRTAAPDSEINIFGNREKQSHVRLILLEEFILIEIIGERTGR